MGIGDFGQFGELRGTGQSFRTAGGDTYEKALGNAEMGGGSIAYWGI